MDDNFPSSPPPSPPYAGVTGPPAGPPRASDPHATWRDSRDNWQRNDTTDQPSGGTQRQALRGVATAVVVVLCLVAGAVIGHVTAQGTTSSVGVTGETPAVVYAPQATCSGRPLANTNLVVTAAHCLENGKASSVVYEGQKYKVLDQRMHPDYVAFSLDTPTQKDVAWVSVDHTFTNDGFAARMASPDELAATQDAASSVGARVDLEALGWSAEEVERPGGAASLYVCRTGDWPVYWWSDEINVSCTMPPGTSGSGLVTWIDRTPVLIGVLSTSGDLASIFHDVSSLADILPDEVARAAGW
jgi:hypothetical protein